MEKRKVLRQRSIDKEAESAKRRKILITTISRLIKKGDDDLTKEEIELLEENDEIVQDIRVRYNKGIEQKDRMREWEEDIDVLKKKCVKLAEAINKSKRLVVYTGAGISTSANIPDYRGPNGVWTLMDQGKEVKACDLGLAQPTTAHMGLFMLYKQGKISHIVSQNCDGLHLRSGIPRNKLSEVHGNMFIEVCKTCKPVRPYVRLFDVTERTNRFRHSTRRRCYICGSGLMDTIVHFGERGSIAWPINWNGASRAAEKADMILCLGSSLKVLRRYPWLWCMDRAAKQRPPLYIVNLQWTPKDAAATLKLNGRCDFVISEVLKHLKMRLPEYTPYNDPLLSYATHLNEREDHTTTRRTLIESRPVGVSHISMEASITEAGVIKEVRVEDRFTTAGGQYTDTRSRSRNSSSSESSGSSGSSSSSNSSSNSSSTSSSRNSSSERSEKSSNSEPESESRSLNGGECNGKLEDTTGESRLANGSVCASVTTQVTVTHEVNGYSVSASLTQDNSVITVKSEIKSEELDSSEIAQCQPVCIQDDSNHSPLTPTSIKTENSSCDTKKVDACEGGSMSPFPSPDHTYALSPHKHIKQEVSENNHIPEVKDEPVMNGTTPKNSRYGLRERRTQKYSKFNENHFIQCQEQMHKAVNKKIKKEDVKEEVKQSHRNGRLKEDTKEGLKVKEERIRIKEIEYRTIDWQKDALYFSYEPNFLFLDNDEDDYVCECCDPKTRKKTVSSEENSDAEPEQEETPEDDESCPEAEETKPHAPGWFGKGRRRRGRTK